MVEEGDGVEKHAPKLTTANGWVFRVFQVSGVRWTKEGPTSAKATQHSQLRIHLASI